MDSESDDITQRRRRGYSPLDRLKHQAIAHLLELHEDLRVERSKQLDKFGDQRHLESIGDYCGEDLGLPTEDEAKARTDEAAKAGECTWAHILVEGVVEAIGAANEPDELRAELVQVAAVVAAWIQKLDTKGEATWQKPAS